MPVPRSILIAVDTNFLLDLEAGSELALSVVEILKQRVPGRIVLVPPTVIDELMWGAENWEGKSQRLAYCALVNLKAKWEFQPVDLIPVGHGIIEITAMSLIGPGLLPEKERNDAFVLSEAALLNCQILISSDRHFANLPQATVTEILKNRDLSPVIIQTPRDIVRVFGGTSRR